MTGQVSRVEWRWVAVFSLAVMAVTALSYLAAWRLTPPGKVYTGMLLNPLDGHSYLAKMELGAAGAWAFSLPYTTEPQQGAPVVYLYYLLLGHLAAWLRLPTIGVYHAARLLAGWGLLLVSYRFIAEFMAGLAARRVSLALLAFSSGLGWLLAALGPVTAPDLWVAESNTFLTLWTNPHFPLAEALMLVVFLAVAAPLQIRGATTGGAPTTAGATGGYAASSGAHRYVLAALAAAALAVLQPFCLATVYLVLGVYLALATWMEGARRRRAAWGRAIVAGLLSLPIAGYYYLSFYQDPALAAWVGQSTAPSPTLWLMLAGYGLLVPLAIVGAAWCARRREGLFLFVWIALGLALLYVPVAFQRRLMMGLHIPIAVLAAIGLTQALWSWAGRRRLAASAVTLLALTVGTLFIVVAGLAGAARAEWPLAMTAGEKDALDWLRESTQAAEVVLAAPQTGLWIPAWAGNRVVYGHPLETLGPARKQAAVEGFFKGEDDPASLLQEYGVRYIFYGPQEKALLRGPGPGLDLTGTLALEPAYSNPEVTLFRVRPAAGARP